MNFCKYIYNLKYKAFMELASAIYEENQLDKSSSWTDTEIKSWDAKGIKLGSGKRQGLRLTSSSQFESIKNASCCFYYVLLFTITKCNLILLEYN